MPNSSIASSIDDVCGAALAELDAQHLRRTLSVSECFSATEILRDGKKFVSFAGNDYLGLRMHPSVIQAGEDALARYGAGAGASRLVTGNHPLYTPLESALATMKKKEAALVFGSGYLANIGTISALMGEGDLILADKLVHACILDGAPLSGATLKRFLHNDVTHAAALLVEHRAHYRHVLIVTESIFSMDGDRGPLSELSALARAHNTWLMVDDAHGLGEASNIQPDIWMGTLSKSIGAYGGYIAASTIVIEFLRNRARSLVFSTGLPPAICASALAAIQQMHAEPQRATRALQLARMLTSALHLPEAQSAILPIITGTAESAVRLSQSLEQRGLLVVAIRPPTVPPNTARLRITLCAEHTDAQVTYLIDALKAEGISA